MSTAPSLTSSSESSVFQRWVSAKNKAKTLMKLAQICANEASVIIKHTTGQDAFCFTFGDEYSQQINIFNHATTVSSSHYPISGKIGGYHLKDVAGRDVSDHWAASLKSVERFNAMLIQEISTGGCIALWERQQD